MKGTLFRIALDLLTDLKKDTLNTINSAVLIARCSS